MNEEGVDPVTVVVRGRVAFPPDDRPDPPYTVAVHIEDASRADAPSTIVGETLLENPTLPTGPAPELDFAVPVPASLLTDTVCLTVRVHVHPWRPRELRRASNVEPGDFVSTRFHPVGQGRELIRVVLQRV